MVNITEKMCVYLLYEITYLLHYLKRLERVVKKHDNTIMNIMFTKESNFSVYSL